MHSIHRSSLRITPNTNMIYIVATIITLLLVVSNYHCLELKQKNEKLKTVIGNNASTIETLELTNNELNTYIDELEGVIQKSAYTYVITSEEREMLARLVYLEANSESLDCQKAIASVVINRWQNGYWGETLEKVVYYKNQFTPITYINQITPNNTNYEAVDYVLKNGCTIPEYVLYFRANYHFNWDGYVAYAKIDDVCFGYLNSDKK